MSKESKNIICEECDSEYTIKYARNMVSGAPVYCTFCGEAMDVADSEADDYDAPEPEADDY